MPLPRVCVRFTRFQSDAPREGRDPRWTPLAPMKSRFQSTRPREGRDRQAGRRRVDNHIVSIHAPP